MQALRRRRQGKPLPHQTQARCRTLPILVPSVHRTSQRRQTPGQQHEALQTRLHQMPAQQLAELQMRELLQTWELLQMPAQQHVELQTRELLQARELLQTWELLQMPAQQHKARRRQAH